MRLIPSKNISRLMIAFSILGLSACGGSEQSTTTTPPPIAEQPPTVIVDESHVTVGAEQASVTLTVSATDASGIKSFLWTQTSGKTVTLRDADTDSVSFDTPVVNFIDGSETLVFNVEVTDNQEASTNKEISVTIEPNNHLPMVQIDGPTLVDELTEVNLNAIAQDEDGSIVAYFWQQVSGPSVTLDSSDEAQLTFSAPQVLMPQGSQSLRFSVTATDDDGAMASQQITLEVTPVNQLPTLVLSHPESVFSLQSVELSGNASDVDGEVVQYAWQQTQGPEVALSNNDTALISFIAPAVQVSTELGWHLTVTDNESQSTTKSLTMYIEPAVPQVTMPQAQSVNEQTEVTLTAQVSDVVAIDNVMWQQVSGPEVQLRNAQSSTAEFTAPVVTVADAQQLLVFEFMATNITGMSHSGTTEVSVSAVNRPPQVQVDGLDLVEALSEVTLRALANDEDGEIVSYLWQQTQGSLVEMQGAQTAQMSFIAPQNAQSLSFNVTVTDNEGMSSSLSHSVEVIAKGPEIEVEPHLTVKSGALALLRWVPQQEQQLNAKLIQTDGAQDLKFKVYDGHFATVSTPIATTAPLQRELLLSVTNEYGGTTDKTISLTIEKAQVIYGEEQLIFSWDRNGVDIKRVKLIDMDNDGLDDAYVEFVKNSEQLHLQWFKNLGGFVMAAKGVEVSSSVRNSNYGGIRTLIDINGNGLADYVNITQDEISVALQNTDGTFASKQRLDILYDKNRNNLAPEVMPFDDANGNRYLFVAGRDLIRVYQLNDGGLPLQIAQWPRVDMYSPGTNSCDLLGHGMPDIIRHQSTEKKVDGVYEQVTLLSVIEGKSGFNTKQEWPDMPWSEVSTACIKGENSDTLLIWGSKGASDTFSIELSYSDGEYRFKDVESPFLVVEDPSQNIPSGRWVQRDYNGDGYDDLVNHSSGIHSYLNTGEAVVKYKHQSSCYCAEFNYEGQKALYKLEYEYGKASHRVQYSTDLFATHLDDLLFEMTPLSIYSGSSYHLDDGQLLVDYQGDNNDMFHRLIFKEGVFSEDPDYIPHTWPAGWKYRADHNKDGLLDIYYQDTSVDQTTQSVFVMHNTGNGYSAPIEVADIIYFTGSSVYSTGRLLDVEDVNNDGYPDLKLARYYWPDRFNFDYRYVLYDPLQERYVEPTEPGLVYIGVASTSSPAFKSVSDYSGDGQKDIVGITEYHGNCYYLISDPARWQCGKLSFKHYQPNDAFSDWSLILEPNVVLKSAKSLDFNRDGENDLLFAGYFDNPDAQDLSDFTPLNAWFSYNDDGSFTQHPLDEDWLNVSFKELNFFSAKEQLFSFHYFLNRYYVKVYEFNPTLGNLEATNTLETPSSSYSYMDIDGDGDLDFIYIKNGDLYWSENIGLDGVSVGIGRR